MTDGPLSNPMEALQGFWVVDVENETRAVDIAAQISEAADTRIEVRECADAPPGRRCGDPRLTTSTLAFGRNSRERDVSQLDRHTVSSDGDPADRGRLFLSPSLTNRSTACHRRWTLEPWMS